MAELRGGSRGRITVQAEELDRIGSSLRCAPTKLFRAYLRGGDALTASPVRSHLSTDGRFTWQPGISFVGTFDLLFVAGADRHDVRVVLNPKSSGCVGPQVVIDTPTTQQDVGQPFVLAGWAAISTPSREAASTRCTSGLIRCREAHRSSWGLSTIGGRRPDVAAIHGAQFRDAGYGLLVEGLMPGNYDLAVFAYSRMTGGFVPAKTVRVTVR